MPEVTTHGFRRTVANLIDEEGLLARVGADQLGHSHVSMTQDRYMSRGRVHAEVAWVLDRAAISAEIDTVDLPGKQSSTIVGQVAPADYNGLKVSGSHGKTWIIESHYIPAGYLAVVATYGPNNNRNALAFREHVKPAYRGLRIIPGVGPYPLQDSFYSRSFGTVVRLRGQAAVVQITDGSTYTVPTVAK